VPAPLPGQSASVHPVGARLQIHLLGRFEVARDGVPIPASAWRRRRPADLLTLLALTPGRTLPRQAVYDALWPGKDPAAGANNLHRALYDLRQVLGSRDVDVTPTGVSLEPSAWVDAEEVERAVRAGGLERFRTAVALYRGDLVPDDGQATWLHDHRRRLRGLFAEAAHPVARQEALAGNPGAAIPLLRRLLVADPSSEEAHQLLMRLLAEDGRRTEALHQFDACAAAKRAAGLGAPSLDTEDLRDAIARGEVGPSGDAEGDGLRRLARRLLGRERLPPLRGREGVVAWLDALLARGHGAVVLLGERGAGATRAALEGARLAQGRGFAVLGGVAPAGPGAPGALFADLLSAERHAHPAFGHDPFRAATPGPGRRPEEVRRALFQGVRDALVAAAEGRPLFLLLDDLHAADPTSLELLHDLLRQAPALRLVVVATCHEDAVHTGAPLQAALAHLDTERLARGLHVPALSLAGTREQLGDLLEAVPAEPLAASVHRATDGRPACVEAVVAAWRHTGRVPEDPQAAVRAAVAALPAPVAAWISAAALLGRRFDLALAAATAGLAPGEAPRALQAAVGAGLVDDTGDLARFHCAMAQEAALAVRPAGALPVLHAAAAAALEAAAALPGAEPAPEAVAWHWLRSPTPSRAIPALLAAGHRAAGMGSQAEAAGLLEEALARAAQSGAISGEARREALDALARARLVLGEVPALLRAVEAAMEPAGGAPPPPERRTRAHRWAALAQVALGDLAAALRLVDDGLAEVEGGLADEAAPLLHLRAQLLWHEGRFGEAGAAAARCADAGDRAGDADLSARGRDLSALAAGMLGAPPGPPADAVAPADRRLQDRAPEHPFDVHLVLWERDLLCGWTAERLLHAARLHAARAGARGAVDASGTSLLGEGQALLLLDRTVQAEAALRRAVAIHRAAGDGLGEALSLDRLGGALAARGAHEEALAVLSEGVVAAERGALRRHATCRLHATLAAAWLAAHDVHAAEAATRQAADELERHGSCLVCEAALRKQLLRVALALGRLDEAGAEARALEALAVRRGGALLAGEAALSRARVLAAEGRLGEAQASFAEARQRFRAAGARWKSERAAALEDRWMGRPEVR
jgi:DNA-binding SARP family transcriptional activator